MCSSRKIDLDPGLLARERDGVTQRREEVDTVTGRRQDNDLAAAVPHQLNESEVLPMAAIGRIDERVVVAVAAEHLLQKVGPPWRTLP